MAQFDTIRRTGSAASPKRFLVGIIKSGQKGKPDQRITFTTPITKVAGPDKFRQGAGKIPIEQYAFQVRARTFERFGDAAAAVLKIHHASLKDPTADDVQEYLKLAHKINAGEVEARVIEQPEGFAPAVKEATAEAAA